VNGGEKVARGFVIAGGDGTVLLELAEEVFDQVARGIELFVVVAWLFAGGFGRDDRGLAGLRQRFNHARVSIESLIGNHGVRGDLGEQRVGAFQIVGLPRSEMEAGRIAERIDRGVDLGAQPTFAASDRLRTVFLSAPALC
jgi:hypothetical protein